MNQQSSPQAFNLEPIHITRRNINIGTAFMKSPSPVKNFIMGDELCACYHIVGSGQYIDNLTNKAFPFKPGSLRLWKPNTPCTRVVISKEHSDKYLSVPSEWYTLLEKMSLASPENPVLDLGLHAHIASRYDDLILEAKNQTELNLPLTLNKAFAFIIDLLLPRPAVNQKWRNAMEKAAQILENDFSEKVVISELASQLNMSATNFRRIFESFYGTPPVVYRVRKKIEMIKRILITEVPLLKEVAERFGYADVYTFSRQFKKYTGRTPSEFRNNRS